MPDVARGRKRSDFVRRTYTYVKSFFVFVSLSNYLFSLGFTSKHFFNLKLKQSSPDGF